MFGTIYWDENGALWMKDGKEYRSVGLTVKEEPVVIEKRIASVSLEMGTKTAEEIKVAGSSSKVDTIIKQFNITEDHPVCATNKV